MESVFGKIKGVGKLYREGNSMVIEHDSNIVAEEQLMDVFRTLPSFYKGFFVPTVVGNQEEQS